MPGSYPKSLAELNDAMSKLEWTEGSGLTIPQSMLVRADRVIE